MTDYRPPYRAAGIMGVLVLGLYALTLAPSTSWWDASEYIATAHILGIPHPPGNPLFVVVAKVWTLMLAPLGLSVAVRVNLLAAFTSAVATGFFFLVSHRILSVIVRERWMAILGAASGAIMGATAYTVWNQSVVNEKVYTLSVMVIAVVSWLMLRWYDHRGSPQGIRYLVGAVYLMVLGASNHLMSVLPLPAAGLFVLVVGPSVLFRRKFLARVLPAVILGLSFNFFLPIRAAQNPVINEGASTCETVLGATVAIYTNGAMGCPALASSLSRDQYGKPRLTQRMAPLGHQLQNYYQYFDWQWGRGVDPSDQPGTARLPLTMLFGLLGFLGLVTVVRADRRIALYIGGLTLTVTLGLVVYLNFKYGFSLAPEITDLRLHEVRERDYFFLASFILWGNLAGIGLTGVWITLSERWGENDYVKWSPIFLVALFPLVLNWAWASRAGDYAARDWAYDLLMSVEPYGVLFTNGDNDTFPLWYAQEVEGVRKDVTVIVVQYLYTSWYAKQLRDLTSEGRQRPFESQFAVGLYDSSQQAPPTAITLLTDDQLDAVGSGAIAEDFVVPLGPVSVTYPAGIFLDRAHRLALNIIFDSIDSRPIYFASTGGLLGELGLSRWGVRHGLATKLVMRDLDDPAPEGVVQGTIFGGEWFDISRNLALVRDVYSYRGLRDRAIWADRSTLNIPFHFQFLFTQLADAAQEAGVDQEVVDELMMEAAMFQVTAQGGRLGAGP